MENKLYAYLQEFIMLYPEKTKTVTREELRMFILQNHPEQFPLLIDRVTKREVLQ